MPNNDTSNESRTIWNEGRVVGYSAYEIYLRQALTEDPTLTPASEREWLSSSIALGSSMILKLPTITGSSVKEDTITVFDVMLPSDSKLSTANTVIASYFDGEIDETSTATTQTVSGTITSGTAKWARNISSYGHLIATNLSGTKSATDAVAANSVASWNQEERYRLRDYMKIVDGLVIQPGDWNATTKMSNIDNPKFKANLKGDDAYPRIRLMIKGSITHTVYVMFTAFTVRSILRGTCKYSSTKPEDGDFIGPGTYPWANKIVFSVPTSYISYFASGAYVRELPPDPDDLVIQDTPVIDMKSGSQDGRLPYPVLENYYSTAQTTDKLFYAKASVASHSQGNESGGVSLARTDVTSQMTQPANVELHLKSSTESIQNTLISELIPSPDPGSTHQIIETRLTAHPAVGTSINLGITWEENNETEQHSMSFPLVGGTSKLITYPETGDTKFTIEYDGNVTITLELYTIDPNAPVTTSVSEYAVSGAYVFKYTPVVGSRIQFQVYSQGSEDAEYAITGTIGTSVDIYKRGTDGPVLLGTYDGDRTISYSEASAEDTFDPAVDDIIRVTYATSDTVEEQPEDSGETGTDSGTSDTQPGDDSEPSTQPDDSEVPVNDSPPEIDTHRYLSQIVKLTADYTGYGYSSVNYTLNVSNIAPNSELILTLDTYTLESATPGTIQHTFVYGQEDTRSIVTYLGVPAMIGILEYNGSTRFTFKENFELAEYTDFTYIKLSKIEYTAGTLSATCSLDSTPLGAIDVSVFASDTHSLVGEYSLMYQQASDSDILSYNGASTLTIHYVNQNVYIGYIYYFTSSSGSTADAKRLSRIDNYVSDFTTLGDGTAVLTVYQKKSIYPPALYGTFVSATGHRYLHPLDIVAPGSVKMFFNDDGTTMKDYQDTFPGTTPLNLTSDGELEVLDVSGNKRSVATVSVTSPYGNDAYGAKIVAGTKQVTAISLVSNNTGTFLSVDGTVDKMPANGKLTWRLLLNALRNKGYFNFFNWIKNRLKAGTGIQITNNDTNNTVTITQRPPIAGEGVAVETSGNSYKIINTMPYNPGKRPRRLTVGSDYTVRLQNNCRSFLWYSSGNYLIAKHRDFNSPSQPTPVSVYITQSDYKKDGKPISATVFVTGGASVSYGGTTAAPHIGHQSLCDYRENLGLVFEHSNYLSTSHLCDITFKGNYSHINTNNYYVSDVSAPSVWNVYKSNSRITGYGTTPEGHMEVYATNIRASWSAVMQGQLNGNVLSIAAVSYADGYNDQFDQYSGFLSSGERIVTPWINLDIRLELVLK